MPIVIVSGSDRLPVNLAMALRHLRLLDTQADLAALYLAAANEQVEDYTGRAGITKTYRLDLPGWPANAVELRRTPLQSIVSVQYIADGEAGLTTLDPSNYIVDTTSQPGRFVWADNVSSPALADAPNAVQIIFTAGYGTLESQMSPRFKLAVMMLGLCIVNNPEGRSELKITETPLSLRMLLDGLRILSIAPERS